MTFSHRGMNVCLICDASLSHHTLYMGNFIPAYIYHGSRITYFPVGKKKRKKRLPKKEKVYHRTDFEADRWPETGDFFCWPYHLVCCLFLLYLFIHVILLFLFIVLIYWIKGIGWGHKSLCFHLTHWWLPVIYLFNLFIYLPHPTAEGPPVTWMGSININIKITISKNSLYINKAFKAIKKKRDKGK